MRNIKEKIIPLNIFFNRKYDFNLKVEYIALIKKLKQKNKDAKIEIKKERHKPEANKKVII